MRKPNHIYDEVTHNETLSKRHRAYVLSSDPRKWEEEGRAAMIKMQMLLVHPTYWVDLLASLDATRRENEDLKSRFAEAVKKLKE
jgi:hypothetical protein